jgi:hypothetical protein
VSEGGGISPDSAVAELPVGPFVAALARKAVYFKFVTSMAARGRLDSTTRVTDRLMADFERYLDSTGFQYEEEAAEALRELRSIAADSRYQPSFVAQLETLEKLAAAEKRRSFERYRDEVWRGLHMELAARWQGERGRIQASLEGDRQLGVAVGLLKQPSSYGRRLAR